MTNLQLQMFYDSYEDAIRDTIQQLGGNKAIGNLLWPAIPVDDAGRKLANCLNTEKREKLDLGELQLIRREARKKGIHILAHYEARDAGYAEPMPINPEDEEAQLQREFIAASRSIAAMTMRMEALQKLRAVA